MTFIECSDSELIRRVLEDGATAHGELVRRLLPVVLARVRGMTHGKGVGAMSVEDLAQETFLRLYADQRRLLRAWDPARGSLAALASIVARSVVLASVERHKTALAVSGAPPSLSEAEPASSAPSPEGVAVDRDLLARLRACLEHTLAPEAWLVYVGIYEHGLEPAVLAERYNRPRAWVDRRHLDVRRAADDCRGRFERLGEPSR